MSPPPPNFNEIVSRERGFSLVEAAVVLGVVGVVIGGIWIAAQTISESNKVNRTVEATLKTIEGTRRLYKGFYPNQISTRAIGSVDYTIGSSLYESGVIPRDVFTGCNFGFFINYCTGNAWGAGGYTYFGVRRLNDPTGDYLVQENIQSVSGCIKIAAALSKINFQNYAIKSIDMFGESYTDSSQMTVASLTAACTGWPLIVVVYTP